MNQEISELQTPFFMEKKPSEKCIMFDKKNTVSYPWANLKPKSDDG